MRRQLLDHSKWGRKCLNAKESRRRRDGGGRGVKEMATKPVKYLRWEYLISHLLIVWIFPYVKSFPKVKIVFWWTFLYYWTFMKIENAIARSTPVRYSRTFNISILKQCAWFGIYPLDHIQRIFCKSPYLRFNHFFNFGTFFRVLSSRTFLYF